MASLSVSEKNTAQIFVGAIHSVGPGLPRVTLAANDTNEGDSRAKLLLNLNQVITHFTLQSMKYLRHSNSSQFFNLSGF